MTVCKHASRPSVRDVCRDDASVLALSVVRSIAAGYMTGDVACWDTAFEGTDAVLGDVEGPRFVAAMAAVVRAFRVERQGEFVFMPATCCRVTQDEADLLALLDPSAPAGAAARFARAAAPRLERAVAEARRALARVETLLNPASGRESRPGVAPACPARALH